MSYGRLMRNMQNRRKPIKHMNSFIIARLQRILRKFSENPLTGSRVLGLRSHIYNPVSQVSVLYLRWVLGLWSWVPTLWSRVSGPGFFLRNASRAFRPESRVELFGYTSMRVSFLQIYMCFRPHQSDKIVTIKLTTFSRNLKQ